MQQRYVGVLTDGAEWHLYSLAGDELTLVSSLEVDPKSPDVDRLCLWLEGVLATDEKIKPTPREITARLGADSPAHALDASDLTVLYQAHRDLPAVQLKRELWAKLLTTALGTAFSDDDRLFIEHTLLDDKRYGHPIGRPPPAELRTRSMKRRQHRRDANQKRGTSAITPHA